MILLTYFKVQLLPFIISKISYWTFPTTLCPSISLVNVNVNFSCLHIHMLKQVLNVHFNISPYSLGLIVKLTIFYCIRHSN